ncbi:MAG: cyclophilin-like fold protein [Anaerovoracaceae bacterium]|jgi:hypothetical protein
MQNKSPEMTNITISDGKTELHAVLNEKAAARDFVRRLPCRMKGTDSGTEYCCPAAIGVFDPMEAQTGWKNGDIALCGGWFMILYGGEDESSAYRNMMIIGHLDDDSAEAVREMPHQVEFTVRLSE